MSVSGYEHSGRADRVRRLTRVLNGAAHLLPAQGPISIFVHHNTLHAYEYVPFESAVVEAADVFGCEPFLTETEYRQELAQGRITADDLQWAVADDLGAAAHESIGGLVTRLDFRLGMLRREIRAAQGPALAWMLAEGGIAEAADTTHSGAVPERRTSTRAGDQTATLWDTCVSVARDLRDGVASPPRVPIRHRDLLLTCTGVDSDTLTHPVLIRLCSSFLDQGIAYWPMPDRELGLYHAFRRLYRVPMWAAPGWMRPMAAELDQQERDGRPAVDSVLDSLDDLGVPEAEWEPFLAATLLALRGWAGMIRQVEVRPDRVPVHAPPARLIDFLAVRLLLERFALRDVVSRHLAHPCALADLRSALRTNLPQPPPRTISERAWLMFEMARIHAWPPERLGALSPSALTELLSEYDRFHENERRRLFHLAFERHHRDALFDALCAHAPAPPAPGPTPRRFQALFCIDEREEALRRHTEEVEPACETFGTAGFFGVAMYYRGAGDAHPTPLCPIVIKPRHEVDEVVVEDMRNAHRRRLTRRRWLGLLTYETRLASRTFTRGALLSLAVGLAAAVPLIFRVLLPRWTARVRHRAGRLVRAPRRSRLRFERGDRPVSVGAVAGFTVEEMGDIVSRVLVDSGLTRDFAPLVAVVGHGSSSLNNPHESAHDCGACGGGRGGPNARAFTLMANDPRVRARLGERGLVIPATTHFVGMYHNSCDDAVTVFDAETIPPSHAVDAAHLRAIFDEARTRTAHERCRRFESAPLSLSPRHALEHVEMRAEDLAQPRPEYGHATNAACIIGRRARTRGLFLDRRAFLVSYDPRMDDENGTILARVLAAVVPVVAGINLEYYFSRVDSAGYGCATKLPHNIAALLGVMDGPASDLRTGLPWQMVEIHEPVRLLVVVDAPPERLRRIVGQNHDIACLVQNRWIQLAAWHPDSADITWFARRGPVRYEPATTRLPRAASSIDWYGGRRGFLPYAVIGGGEPSAEGPC